MHIVLINVLKRCSSLPLKLLREIAIKLVKRSCYFFNFLQVEFVDYAAR